MVEVCLRELWEKVYILSIWFTQVYLFIGEASHWWCTLVSGAIFLNRKQVGEHPSTAESKKGRSTSSCIIIIHLFVTFNCFPLSGEKHDLCINLNIKNGYNRSSKCIPCIYPDRRICSKLLLFILNDIPLYQFTYQLHAILLLQDKKGHLTTSQTCLPKKSLFSLH